MMEEIEFQKAVIYILKNIKPNQKMRLSDGEGNIWESFTTLEDNAPKITILKNKKIISTFFKTKINGINGEIKIYDE